MIEPIEVVKDAVVDAKDAVVAKSIRTNGFLSFIRRTWVLILAFVIALVIVILPQPIALIGAMVYAPVGTIGAFLSALIIRQLFFSDTLSEDAHTDYFVNAYHGLSPATRLFLNWGVVLILFLGGAIIFASLAR